jgi:5-methylthioadenosine/S-adenosylhomocysteine deaminase
MQDRYFCSRRTAFIPEFSAEADRIRRRYRHWKRTGGARGLKLDHKTGSLTPGKEADIILLDANAINVAPLNHVPGAVVTLMERSNVSTVLCAGKVRKWQGALLGHDIAKLRVELEGSRDYLIEAAGIKPLYF